ncbi:MAG: cyclic nucleotide-binding domain-containing protein [Beijerinckiaceae bacterium]
MALDSDIGQFQANPLFSLFEVEAIRLIAFSADTRMLRPGDLLFRQGDVSDGGYLVVTGRLSLTDGETEELHGPGALVGELALFTQTARPVSASAAEPTTLRRIPRHLMRRVLTEYPGTAARIRDRFGQRIVDVGGALRAISALLPDAADEAAT